LRLPGALWYLAAAAFVTSAAGILVGRRYLLPALDVAAVFPIFLWARSRRNLQSVTLAVLFWAGCKAVAVATLTVLFPARAAGAILFGPAYAEGMWLWLASGADLVGVGAAGTARLPEAVVLAGLSLATAGAAGLAYAAALLNGQAYYLGTLLLRATEPWKVVVFGWPLWEVFRALGLANLLVVAAEPLAARLLGRPTRGRDVRDGLMIAALMLALAYVAHISLAAWWRELLAPALIFEAPELWVP
jgi:hypothetical protein